MIAWLAVAWLFLSVPASLLVGSGIRMADRQQLAEAVPLFPPAGWSGEEGPRRGLPAHLSPRAGAGCRRVLRRLRRPYGWLVGLLLAGVLCVALSALQDLTPATAIR